MSDLYSHILGGLYGEALGDAWGMPAYLIPEQTWRKFGGWIERFLPAPDDHPFHLGMPAGRITDDTEQAFALARSIIADGGVTVEGVARAIVEWYDSVGGDESSYIGPSTRRAVLALKSGADPRTTGLYGDTDGGAMRIAPVGLIHPGDVAGAVVDTAIACTPTHFTNVAISGAAAVAGSIARAMEPGSELDDIIAAGKQAARQGKSLGHQWVGADVARRIDWAVEIARGSQPPRQRLQDLYDLIGSTLATTESVPSVFGVLVMADGDPVQAAIYSAGLSGDADTVGAMACAITGAWRGVEAIPEEHIATLRAVNPELDFEGVAQGLLALVQNSSR